VELDVVARTRDGSLLVGECRWQGAKMDPSSLEALKRRASRFPRFGDRPLRYALFSKSGFTKPLLASAHEERVLLFEGADFRESARHRRSAR
jgi:hypothetical protein